MIEQEWMFIEQQSPEMKQIWLLKSRTMDEKRMSGRVA